MKLFQRRITLIIIFSIFFILLFAGHVSAQDKIIQIRNGYVVTSAYEVNTTGWEVLESKQVEFSELQPKTKLITIISEYIPFGDFLLAIFFSAISSGLIAYFGLRLINRNNALKNKNRVKISEIIEKNPGINFTDIVRELGITKSIAKYHLNKLVVLGIIRPFSVNGISGYFKNNNTFSTSEMKLLLIQKNSKDKQILEILTMHPGIARNEISMKIGLSGPAVTWHMKRLEKSGFVDIVRDGRNARYFLNKNLDLTRDKNPVNYSESLQAIIQYKEAINEKN